ncbi:Ig-like and fibronectin type-III domain-containing protein 1 [Liolophura sinensis]|uniref:Ig-like and fibronectin type-III domain-containing protein 1 n=1 Tax=Liolophura sinensis TaxID=3198878 RepID=UPI0031598FEE
MKFPFYLTIHSYCAVLHKMLLPRSPVNVTVLNVTAHTITLQWEPDNTGPRPTGYILEYTTLDNIQEVGAVPSSYWQQDKTNRTVHILQNLKSGFYYLISVVSENDNGSSVPREYLPVLTNADADSGIGFTTPGPGTTPHPGGVQPTEPPVNRTDCCTTKGVREECLSVCEQGDITSASCSSFVLSTLACSADGGDHSGCCRRRDVPLHCWGLCSGQTDYDNNPVSVFCASYADVIMFCTQRSAGQ